MDIKGNFFSNEIIIVLIFFIIIIGISANLTDNITEKMTSSLELNNLEKLSSESLDTLINNPGIPNDWENLSNYGNIHPGFAILNSDNKTIKNSVSFFKISKLENNYDLLIKQKVFNGNIKSSIAIYPLNSSIPSYFYGDIDERENVISINRLIKCDFYSTYTLLNFNEKKECNHNHDKNNYSCASFTVYKSYLKDNDYYLLSGSKEINNLYWSIDTTNNKSSEYKKISNNKIYLNDYIANEMKSSSNEIFFIHLKDKSAKVVLVSVPKDFNEKLLIYDYFIITPCKIVLKTWY
ncbi:hypothetical protein LJB96_04270 [Methanobrevibacter sp. OttesenSCG-928-K11]|nr:hypothetical protein [Methanobrevibacter sp. OttesenSCG-928-K11]MDL2270371.1 hypothetical protein [Methanobrevibacter sp. OttesenSCG-928-I08]